MEGNYVLNQYFNFFFLTNLVFVVDVFDILIEPGAADFVSVSAVRDRSPNRVQTRLYLKGAAQVRQEHSLSFERSLQGKAHP